VLITKDEDFFLRACSPIFDAQGRMLDDSA
jgi:hypothetical protein